MPIKRPHKAIYVRLPLDVKEWLEREVEQSFASINAEIVRALRERMARAAERAA